MRPVCALMVFVLGVAAVVALGWATHFADWSAVPGAFILLGSIAGSAFVTVGGSAPLSPSTYRPSATPSPDRDTAAHCYRTAAERNDETPCAKSTRIEEFVAIRQARCPKCTVAHGCYSSACPCQGGNNRGPIIERICTGSWWRRCSIRREHFHVRCASCGAKWVMGTADAAEHVERLRCAT